MKELKPTGAREYHRQLEQMTASRDYWYKKTVDAERERDEIRQAAQDQNDEAQPEQLRVHLASERRLQERLTTLDVVEEQVVSIRDAVTWLWGYYDGNTLVAKPGYEDDILAAWNDLLAVVGPPDSTPAERQITTAQKAAIVEAAEGLRGQLAKAEARLERALIKCQMTKDGRSYWYKKYHDAEAALADCGIGGIFAEFDGLPDAIEQMAQHIKELASRLTQAQADLDAAEAALADCGSRGIYTDFDGPADAIMQMAARIEKLEDESMVEVEITGKEMVEALQEERRERVEAERCHRVALALAQDRGERLEEAEQRVENWCQEILSAHRVLDNHQAPRKYGHAGMAGRILSLAERATRAEAQAELQTHQAGRRTENLQQEKVGIHEALDECQILRNYDDGKPASARTRIFWLNQRAERAENAEAELDNGHKALTAAGVPRSDASGYKYSIAGRVVRLRKIKQHTEALHPVLVGVHKALDEYRADAYDDSTANARTRIARLGQRTERAEARAALVNEETAALLERLALRVLEYGVGKEDARQGRERAARIREALALEADREVTKDDQSAMP